MQRLLSEQLPTVLFKDYNGYWRPLKNLYWSQSSEALVARHPNSSVDEIVSQYCPQCLTRYSGEEATAQQNRCSNCYQCPCCSGLLVFVKLSSKTQDSDDVVAIAALSANPEEVSLAPSTEEKSAESEIDGESVAAAAAAAAAAETAVAVEPVEAPNCVLFCEMCMWQSEESDIIGADKADIGAIIKSRDSVTQVFTRC
jgi:adenosine/AMP kinase